MCAVLCAVCVCQAIFFKLCHAVSFGSDDARSAIAQKLGTQIDSPFISSPIEVSTHWADGSCSVLWRHHIVFCVHFSIRRFEATRKSVMRETETVMTVKTVYMDTEVAVEVEAKTIATMKAHQRVLPPPLLVLRFVFPFHWLKRLRVLALGEVWRLQPVWGFSSQTDTTHKFQRNIVFLLPHTINHKFRPQTLNEKLMLRPEAELKKLT